MPCCFSRSSIKFQDHTGQEITNIYPNWGFSDCNSSVTSPMDLKWCTKLGVVKKRCLIAFRGHSSNFKVTQADWSTNVTLFVLGRSQLSKPSDLPWYKWDHWFQILNELFHLFASIISCAKNVPTNIYAKHMVWIHYRPTYIEMLICMVKISRLLMRLEQFDKVSMLYEFFMIYVYIYLHPTDLFQWY